MHIINSRIVRKVKFEHYKFHMRHIHEKTMILIEVWKFEIIIDFERDILTIKLTSKLNVEHIMFQLITKLALFGEVNSDAVKFIVPNSTIRNSGYQ